jgi:hypothetical protein
LSLKQFIKDENRVIAMFPCEGETLYPEDPKKLDEAQRKRISASLSRALTPEALTCDGEIRGAKLLAKKAKLAKAKEELVAMGQEVEVW